jgi:hypothetical protein
MLTTFACGTSDSVAQETASDEVSSAGIQVHGHWTLNVINPDGEIANTYEFENDLDKNGSALLINLLAGNGKVEDHALVLTFDGATCEESISEFVVPASIVQNYEKPRSLMLSGFCTVEMQGPLVSDHRLIGLATRFNTDEALSYHADYGSKHLLLTQKWFTPYLDVTEGQKIAANVKLTFE